MSRNSKSVGRLDARPASFEGKDPFRKIMELVRVRVAFIIPEGIIGWCNPAYATILGMTPEVLTGRSFFEFLNAAQEKKAHREREVRLEDVPSEYEIAITAADGSEKRLLATGAPLYGEDGTYLGAVQTLTDVTEQKRSNEALKRSEERFRLGGATVSPASSWPRPTRTTPSTPRPSSGRVRGPTWDARTSSSNRRPRRSTSETKATRTSWTKTATASRARIPRSWRATRRRCWRQAQRRRGCPRLPQCSAGHPLKVTGSSSGSSASPHCS